MKLYALSDETETDFLVGRRVQVRWFSFQFVLAQLADEVSNMHNAMGRLLVRFPQTALPDETSARSQARSYEPLVHSDSFLGVTAEEGRAVRETYQVPPQSPLRPLMSHHKDSQNL